MSQKYILGHRAQTRYRSIRYVVAVSLAIILLTVVQVSVCARFRLLGAVADLMICFVLCMGYFTGPYTGAVCGIAAGFLIEAMGSTGITLLPLCYLFAGYLVGYYVRTSQKNFLQYLIYLAVILLYRAFITVLYASLHYNNLRLPTVLLYAVLPELLATALGGLILYFPMKLFCGWLEKK